jgi:hypothetical protein
MHLLFDGASFQQVIFGLLNKASTLAIYIRAKLKSSNYSLKAKNTCL